jgi:hypothetical protein
LGEEQSAKEGIFRTAICIPFFFNSFDQIEGLTMHNQADSGVLALEPYRGTSHNPKILCLILISFRNKKIKLNILNH